MADQAAEHNQLIVDQFTRQATPFAQMPEHSDSDAMRQLIDAAGITASDQVLDIACGPGIVACAIAPLAQQVTGIDITPAMIEQAKSLQRQKGISNLSWEVGNVEALPFSDESFSIVLTRYTFHHFLNPGAVLREMTRVCRHSGRVVVADVFTTSNAQAAAYDRVEKWRDPSHARALGLEELKSLFADAGIALDRQEFYRLGVELESLLRATATEPSAADQVRQLLAADIGKNETGMSPRRVGSAIHFSFPVVVLAGTVLHPGKSLMAL